MLRDSTPEELGFALEEGLANDRFFKTAMCKFHLRSACNKGPDCRFAHTWDELRALPDLRWTRMCPKLMREGTCGNYDCTFAHRHEALRQVRPLRSNEADVRPSIRRFTWDPHSASGEKEPILPVSPMAAAQQTVPQRPPRPPPPPSPSKELSQQMFLQEPVPPPPRPPKEEAFRTPARRYTWAAQRKGGQEAGVLPPAVPAAAPKELPPVNQGIPAELTTHGLELVRRGKGFELVPRASACTLRREDLPDEGESRRRLRGLPLRTWADQDFAPVHVAMRPREDTVPRVQSFAASAQGYPAAPPTAASDRYGRTTSRPYAAAPPSSDAPLVALAREAAGDRDGRSTPQAPPVREGRGHTWPSQQDTSTAQAVQLLRRGAGVDDEADDMPDAEEPTRPARRLSARHAGKSAARQQVGKMVVLQDTSGETSVATVEVRHTFLTVVPAGPPGRSSARASSAPCHASTSERR